VLLPWILSISVNVNISFFPVKKDTHCHVGPALPAPTTRSSAATTGKLISRQIGLQGKLIGIQGKPIGIQGKLIGMQGKRESS
jgi:hypothetical protein